MHILLHASFKWRFYAIHRARAISPVKGQTHLEFEQTLPENNDRRSESDDPDRPSRLASSARIKFATLYLFSAKFLSSFSTSETEILSISNYSSRNIAKISRYPETEIIDNIGGIKKKVMIIKMSAIFVE